MGRTPVNRSQLSVDEERSVYDLEAVNTSISSEESPSIFGLWSHLISFWPFKNRPHNFSTPQIYTTQNRK